MTIAKISLHFILIQKKSFFFRIYKFLLLILLLIVLILMLIVLFCQIRLQRKKLLKLIFTQYGRLHKSKKENKKVIQIVIREVLNISGK